MKRVLLAALLAYSIASIAQQEPPSAWDQFMNGINRANEIANPPNQFQNFPQAGGTIRGSQIQQPFQPPQQNNQQQNQTRQPINCNPNGFGGYTCQ